MKVLELFAGTRSIGRAFEARGHEVFSVDWDASFEGIDYCGDVMGLTADEPDFLPMCHNGDLCHARAPRGAKTGTQGLAKVDRSRIPAQLCEHIVDICEVSL